MKSVFEHSTVNELREMQDFISKWMRDRRPMLSDSSLYKVLHIPSSLVSAYQVMFTFYSEVSQELKKRMEITNG